MHFGHQRFRRKQRGGLLAEGLERGGIAQVGFVGDQNVAHADLVFVERVGGVVGIGELARIDKGEDGGDFQRVGKLGRFEFVDYAGGMRQPAGFDQDALGAALGEHFAHGVAHLAAGGAAQTAAGDFGHRNAVVGQYRAVDADFAELVDDQQPLFGGAFLLQQAAQGGGFAGAEKAGKQVDFGF